MIKAILGFTWDSFLIVWTLFLMVVFILSAVLTLHLGGVIAADPVIVLMDRVMDGSIRWIAALMFP